MRVAVFYNTSRITSQTLIRLTEEIESHNIKANFFTDGSDRPVEGTVAILTFGGDGTVLKAIPMAQTNNLPILSFRVGSVGFLTAFEITMLHMVLNLFSENKLQYSERPLMRISIEGDDFFVLNDCVLERSSPSRTVSFTVTVDDLSSYPVAGDGIIFSTNIGSTAYSMAAGGALVDPQANCFQVTPICPHNPFVGPLVLASSRKVKLSVTQDKGFPLEVYMDGKFNRKVLKGDELKVCMSDRSVRLLREGDFDFVALLKKKLAFGGRLKDDI